MLTIGDICNFWEKRYISKILKEDMYENISNCTIISYLVLYGIYVKIKLFVEVEIR